MFEHAHVLAALKHLGIGFHAVGKHLALARCELIGCKHDARAEADVAAVLTGGAAAGGTAAGRGLDLGLADLIDGQIALLVLLGFDQQPIAHPVEHGHLGVLAERGDGFVFAVNIRIEPHARHGIAGVAVRVLFTLHTDEILIYEQPTVFGILDHVIAVLLRRDVDFFAPVILPHNRADLHAHACGLGGRLRRGFGRGLFGRLGCGGRLCSRFFGRLGRGLRRGGRNRRGGRFRRDQCHRRVFGRFRHDRSDAVAADHGKRHQRRHYNACNPFHIASFLTLYKRCQ